MLIMTVNQKIANIAKSYIGKTEKPPNAGFNDAVFQKKLEEVGWLKNQSWCSYFGELVWKEAYEDQPEIVALIDSLFSGSATKTFSNFKKAEDFGANTLPTLGSLVMWQLGNSWQGHLGIVTDSGDFKSFFKSVEGNTNNKSEREGYIVAEKTRILKPAKSARGLNLLGFIHPI